MKLRTRSNPDLAVGRDNKQRWNQPAHRREGFHSAHRLFRRAAMVRARHVLELHQAPPEDRISHPAIDRLTALPIFSALTCARGDRILLERSAPDFAPDRPHSIQSITKMHIHLIVGRLCAEGRLDLSAPMGRHLPEIGPGYANLLVQDVLDMAISNDFSEDYDDPAADCYAEEVALGWRLPLEGEEETTLAAFVSGIGGGGPLPANAPAAYKSANTDALTLLAASLSPRPLLAEIEAIADAAGYAGAFHISLSPEGLPAFSGGGCLSARDLARFGLLFARRGRAISGQPYASESFLRGSLERPARLLPAPRGWLRYSNHVMTDGRFLGHAGYGGQFLMVDTATGLACAFLSVLENDAGFDSAYASEIVDGLRALCHASG